MSIEDAAKAETTWQDRVAGRVLPVLIADDISLSAEEHAREAYEYADALAEVRSEREKSDK